MYYSRPFQHQERGHTDKRREGRPGKDGSGQQDEESISGMLTNFSKALGDIREIREKRMQSLGPGGQEKQSPTMFGGGGLFGGSNQQQARPFGNQQNQPNQQQQQYNQGMQGMNQGMNQSGSNQMNRGNQGFNQSSGMNQGGGFNNQGMNQQQPNMVRQNNGMQGGQYGQNNGGGFINNQQGFNSMMPQQQQQQNNFQPNMQQPQQQNFQQQPPMQQQQQQQNYAHAQSIQPAMVAQPQIQPMLQGGQPVPPLQYVSAPFNQQQPGALLAQQPGQAGLVTVQQPAGYQLAGQPSLPPTYVIQTSQPPQTSFLQPGGQAAPPGQVVLQQPGSSGPLVTTTQPGLSGMVVVQPPAQPGAAQQVVHLVASSGQPLTATPAPYQLSAPTPQPLVVSSVPLSSSTTNYTFDPAGLTPAQQLAYAQAQQQHQQQHLKKMRQRLPHVSGRELQTLHKQIKDLQHKQHLQTVQTLRLAQVQEKQAFNYLDTALKQTRQPKNTYHRVGFHLKGGKSGSPHMSRKYEGPQIGQAHLPSAALLHEAKLASSVVSSHGPSAATKEHEKRILESILPPDLRHLIRGGTSGSTFHSIQQIETSLRTSGKGEPSDAEIARLNAEKRLFGGQRERIVAEMQRYATMKDPRLRAEMKHKLNPVMDAQLNRNRARQRGHRRNLSDGRISSATEHLGEDIGAYSSLPGRPYSSMSGGFAGGLDPLATDPLGLDNSQSYLGVADGGHYGSSGLLRDSSGMHGYGTVDSEESNRARFLASHSRLVHRRASAGGLEGHAGLERASDPYGLAGAGGHRQGYNASSQRPHSSMSGKHGSRTWHNSPWGSDDEREDQEHHFFKEEKKNRIKMEISRRRHQIEENARLHEELIRLAKLRENAELGTMDYNSHRLGVTGYPSPSLSPGREGQSVLRSVDEILRTEPGAPHHYGLSSTSSLHRAPGRLTGGTGREFGMGVTRLGAAHHLEDHGHDPGAGLNHTRPSFNADRYTSSVYDRVTDFSPVNSDYSNEFSHNPAIPILPDMASRSRKLMDEMNTSTSYQANDKYASRSNYGYR